MDRSIWEDLVESQLGDQLVILPDLRGHGESDAPEGIYSMSLMAADLAYLLDILGLRRRLFAVIPWAGMLPWRLQNTTHKGWRGWV
jgi:pimeloyl-ACP methyl ester carboxylesterase